MVKDDFILITGGSGFIGTNLQEDLINKNIRYINLDIKQPTNKVHIPYWVKGDIMDPEVLRTVFSKYNPTIVIHFAARTDTSSPNLEDYEVNYKGTELLISEIIKHDNILRCVFTSTQYVYKDQGEPFPKSDNTYKPHTTYGISKMMSEKIVRNASLKCAWTIVRPTNVWGPWHLRFPNQLWKFIDKGLYFHPTKKTVVRSYAYVKNLNFQILGILNAPINNINGKTYYLGDLPIDSNIWLNAWCRQLTGHKLKYIPSIIMWLAAKLGDLLNILGIKFPIYTIRYRNMMENYISPTNVTIREFGILNDDLQDNINETIAWLKKEGKTMFKYWSRKK